MENQTPSPKPSGRGGARPGAGRKKKSASHQLAPSALAKIDIEAALATPAPDEIEALAKADVAANIPAMVQLMLHAASESVRVKNAKRVLDRGYGKPAVEIGGDAALLLPFAAKPVSSETLSLNAAIRNEARKYAPLALAVLRRIREAALSETARGDAAEALIERVVGTVGTARMPDETARERPLGKKEEAQLAAKTAASGIYASRRAPALN